MEEHTKMEGLNNFAQWMGLEGRRLSHGCHIGYGDEVFGYRFWDDQNWKIIRSWNVVFNECGIYKDGWGA